MGNEEFGMNRIGIFISFLLLKMLDVITTMMGMNRRNLHELNPIVEPLLLNFGIWGLVGISILQTVLLTYMVLYYLPGKEHRIINLSCGAVIVSFFLVPLWNMIMLGLSLFS